jgi:ketosteroid isomerase-like protein
VRSLAAMILLVAALLAGCAADERFEPVLDPQSEPEETLVALIDAINSEDWETVYSLYAEPEVDLETAFAEWEEAAERYEEFTVHEVTERGDTAEALVTYVMETTPPGGDRYEVVVNGEGERWALVRVDGRWLVKWMPRQ